jgi:hypothetical protein
VAQKKRSEVALSSLVHKAFINDGVCTRKLERLARNQGIEDLGLAGVGDNQGLDERVE